MSERARWQRDYERVVRARCRKCSRVVAELYGTDEGLMVGWSSPDGSRSGLMLAYGRMVKWPCRGRCTAKYVVRGEKLAAAFAVAATHESKRDRVIWLPDQL